MANDMNGKNRAQKGSFDFQEWSDLFAQDPEAFEKNGVQPWRHLFSRHLKKTATPLSKPCSGSK